VLTYKNDLIINEFKGNHNYPGLDEELLINNGNYLDIRLTNEGEEKVPFVSGLYGYKFCVFPLYDFDISISDSPSIDPNLVPSEVPILEPTDIPSILTASPTEVPSSMPSRSSQFYCPSYSVSYTNNAEQNYATCEVYACPGSTIVISGCGPGACSGDQYLSLFDSSNYQVASNDDNCESCSEITYITSQPCQTYSIHEGCYDSNSCGGTLSVAVGDDSPTETPTLLPSIDPSSQFYCPSYSASNTSNAEQNYATCEVYACPGSTIVISGCGPGACSGDQYLSLYDSSNNQVASNDDNCGSCSEIKYITAQPCQTYSIHEGCYGSNSCGGTLLVTVMENKLTVFNNNFASNDGGIV
jgi:hypothetical protein